MRRPFFLGLLAACSVFAMGSAQAQAASYPTRAITLLVPYTAGGGVDVGARIIAQQLSERLGQPVIIDNRPGVSGMVGTQMASRAAPDGYTLLAGNMTTNVINGFMYKNLGYHPDKDFVPIALVNTFPTVLVVKAGSRFKSVGDVIAAAKADPNGLSYGTAGNGSAQHLAATLFQSITKTSMRQIPYKGAPGIMTDLMGGSLDLAFDVVPIAQPLVNSKRLTGLGVSSRVPVASLPGVRPIADLGAPNYEMMFWNGIFAPAGTPPAIAERLGREIAAVIALPEVQKKLTDLGSIPGGQRNAAFGEIQHADFVKWGNLIREAGIQPD
jgi:tripartite-type tricarboxylate transporter receptor subunit TctC